MHDEIDMIDSREKVIETEAEVAKDKIKTKENLEKIKELEEEISRFEDTIRRLKIENKSLTEKNKILENANESIKNRAVKLEKLSDAQRQTLEILLDKQVVIKSDKLEDFLTRQKRIFQNKVNHGFNTTNIYQEARYILEEVAELMRAIEKNDRENMIEELADIIIFTYGCAEVARLGDLDTKVFEKMAINEKREYKKTDEGDFVKTGGELNE